MLTRLFIAAACEPTPAGWLGRGGSSNGPETVDPGSFSLPSPGGVHIDVSTVQDTALFVAVAVLCAALVYAIGRYVLSRYEATPRVSAPAASVAPVYVAPQVIPSRSDGSVLEVFDRAAHDLKLRRSVAQREIAEIALRLGETSDE